MATTSTNSVANAFAIAALRNQLELNEGLLMSLLGETHKIRKEVTKMNSVTVSVPILNSDQEKSKRKVHFAENIKVDDTSFRQSTDMVVDHDAKVEQDSFEKEMDQLADHFSRISFDNKDYLC